MRLKILCPLCRTPYAERITPPEGTLGRYQFLNEINRLVCPNCSYNRIDAMREWAKLKDERYGEFVLGVSQRTIVEHVDADILRNKREIL